MNTLDFISAFNQFREDRDNKIMKLIKQVYDKPKYFAVPGRSQNEKYRKWDPKIMRKLDFNLVIANSNDTPVFKQIIDDQLMQMLNNKLIDLEIYLKNTSMPYADKILEDIKQKQNAVQQGQNPGQIPADLMNQVGEQTNPQAMQMLNGAQVPQGNKAA